MEKIKDFHDLKIWQQAIALVKRVYAVTSNFPKEEIYGLTSQLRRSSVSIPSNIAEGFRRFQFREFKNYLNIALGSIGELETQIIISAELGFLDINRTNELLEKIVTLGKMTMKFRNSLKPYKS
jgi:four helix bundle protein